MKVLRMADQDLAGKRVLIRADMNVPQDDSGRITDDTRIRASMGGIRAALEKGAAVMVTSHLGRPTEGQFSEADSLAPVARRLSELLGRPVPLVRDWVDGVGVEPGEAVMLENCRFNKGEKKNDEALAKKYAALADVYVNDAFGTAHRAEASTQGVAKFAKVACAGPLLAAEIDALSRALASLKSLADKVDQLIPGGGIANTFLLAAGLPIGKSLVEAQLAPEAKEIMVIMEARGAAVPLPTDVVCGKAFAADTPASVKAVRDVQDDDMILDIGPQSAKRYAELLESAGTIVWNGPVGVFEFPAFEGGTKALAQAIAGSKAFSIAGGGDTLAAIARFGVTDRIGYISTGGGAFLEFLEGKKLPAIEVLESRASGSPR